MSVCDICVIHCCCYLATRKGVLFPVRNTVILQCFNAVGWVTGRASGLLKFCHNRVYHKPEKSGILRDLSEHGKLREFCATSGKNCNKHTKYF